MSFKIHFSPILQFLRRGSARFSIFWTVGLLLGTVAAAKADPVYFSLMRQAAGCRVSIIGLLAAILLPFLFAAYAVSISRPALLLAVISCKACCFAFSSYLAWAAFGSAGWLIQPLVQFTDLCTVPVLCWFCIRHLSDRIASIKRDLTICVLVILSVVGMDFFVVSPFLAGLIDH